QPPVVVPEPGARARARGVARRRLVRDHLERARTRPARVRAHVDHGAERLPDAVRERLPRADGLGAAPRRPHGRGRGDALRRGRVLDRRGAAALLSSGLAGGILGTRALAERLDLRRVIATDVGGTSFDVGLVVDGDVSYAESPIFAQYP